MSRLGDALTELAALAELGRRGAAREQLRATDSLHDLRPEEAANLRAHNLALPESGWGELHLESVTPHAGREWTDNGRVRDERQLKHRAKRGDAYGALSP